jgi:heptose I phosphotransferase
MQEWRHLRWAAAQGLPVPRPVAAGQWAGPWGRLSGFLAVEELPDMLALHEAVPLAAGRLPPDVFRRWKRGLIREMVRLVRQLHDRDWFHHDLYLCHFYIPEADTAAPPANWVGRVHVIDLHRLGRRPLSAFYGRAKDLSQLLYSSDVAGVTVRDRVWFWRAYRGGQTRALLRRLALYKWQQYLRKNNRRRNGNAA